VRNDAGIPDRVFIVRQLQDTDGKAGAVLTSKPATSYVVPTPPSTRARSTESPLVDGLAADRDLAPITMSVGTTQLWRFVNAATDAFLDLALIDEAGKPAPVQVLARAGAPAPATRLGLLRVTPRTGAMSSHTSRSCPLTVTACN
jgi:hypothetical protein